MLSPESWAPHQDLESKKKQLARETVQLRLLFALPEDPVPTIGGLQPPVTPVTRDQHPLLASKGIHTLCTHSYKHIYIHIIKKIKLFFFYTNSSTIVFCFWKRWGLVCPWLALNLLFRTRLLTLLPHSTSQVPRLQVYP